MKSAKQIQARIDIITHTIATLDPVSHSHTIEQAWAKVTVLKWVLADEDA